MDYALESLIKIVIVLGAVITAVAYVVLAERKVSAYIQNRLGPNRVGPWGLLQPLADGLKFITKEDVIPNHVNKPVYLIAPAAILIPALMGFAVVPFGDVLNVMGREVALVIANLDIGVLYVLALSSLGVYGVVLGGWASNNKYALMGGIRASAQMISYELSLGLSLIGVLMISGTLRLTDVVNLQAGTQLFGILPAWFVFTQPVACILFIVSVFAETNRLPFDLPEAEQELVAGYHAEYSSMKFAMFFMAEYAHMITASALIATLFFGGWHLPGLDPADDSLGVSILKVLVFSVKTAFFLFVFIWVRWTVPRFRYDQVMRLGWKYLLPIALANVFVTGLVLTLMR
ncbi:MAG: NADH-quinone oxidoreductase subunit NuoH [Gemmatimonadetes bacterium]|nr:NADH-quinone oxidoreductase subunit NuoH [Gemmatimonadota bacterium]|tara:strand:- start:1531 stop:2568 length:1038 start_codon:yes stop_codon:yes gene_type:complete